MGEDTFLLHRLISIKNKTAQYGIRHFFDKTFMKTFLNKNSMDTAGLKKCPGKVS